MNKMGDLKVGENFEDRIYYAGSGTPSCTIIDESGNRGNGSVASMGNSWFKVTDFTPDAVGTWCVEWKEPSGSYLTSKEFKVGGGVVGDISTRKVHHKDFWGAASASVTIDNSSGDVDLPDVVVPTLPTGVTLYRVELLFVATGLQDTSGADNAINGASSIRVKKSSGTWGVDCIQAYVIPDNFWQIKSDNGAERGGDAFVGNIDLKGEVDGAATYNLRFEDIAADGNNLVLLNVKVGLRIHFY